MTVQPTEQHDTNRYTGLEFIGGFAALAGGLWVLGAATVFILVLMSGAPSTLTPASNQTPVAESSDTPTTESVQTVDVPPGEPVPEGETPATP